MNAKEETLECLLRDAPSPRPPPQLKDQLIARIALPVPLARGTPADANPLHSSDLREWLRAWWPTVATASLALAALAAVAYQQEQIAELRQAVEAIERPTTPANPPAPAIPAPASAEPVGDPRGNLDWLKKTVAELTPEVARLEALAVENAQLQQTLAGATGLSEAEVADFKALQEKAQSVACINNLKQLGLAARVWATDNQDVLPPDILSMTNEMGSMKILVCPADTRRQPAVNWASYSAANCSYEHLAPSGSETEPQRVVFRCPIHGHVTLCDGSVQARVAFEHPDWFVLRDGKLFLEH
jgi:hypothetical protein